MINQSQEILSNAINTSYIDSGKPLEQERRRLMNVRGVLTGPQFMLVALLVIVSVSSVWLQTDELHLHERYLRMYFNMNILGMDNQGLYEEGDNIDQAQNQIVTFDDMCSLLKELANVTNNYHQDGIVLFKVDQKENQLIRLEFQYVNSSYGSLVFATAKETFKYFQGFQTNFTRDFLLSIKTMKLKTKLGSSKYVNNYFILATFTLHQHLIFQANFQYSYDQPKSHINRKIQCLRVLEQVIATVLLVTFVYRLFILANHSAIRSNKQKQQLREKYKKWFLFMSALNIIILFSQIYAPMAAWLQLLPLFQSPEQDQKHEHQSYNFNRNIRFSTSLILTIWVPLILCLNGFIFYSMLMYANSDQAYFSSYFYAFCDYLYNMFQCGTNQLFVEMQMYGPFAEILYAFLYFYVFEVGTALIPALFCTLIQMKLNERDIAEHSANLMKKAICPNCSTRNNYKFDAHVLSILVSSPRLTPLVKQKKLALSPSIRGKKIQSNKEIVLEIEHAEQEAVPLKNRYKLGGKFVNYSKKMQSLFRQLNTCVSKEHAKTELLRMQSAVQRYKNQQV